MPMPPTPPESSHQGRFCLERMTSYSWVKLYHEVLHDPKMGRLTDNLWRRVIEVILLAGETGKDGLLPELDDMAWTLRLSKEQLEADLQQLARAEIVSLTPQGWNVIHFSNRQAPIDVKDRVSAYRNRIQKHDYYAEETTEKQESNDTVTNRNTEKSKSKSKSKNKSRSDKSENSAAKPPVPPAVIAYKESAYKYPSKTLYEMIDQRVGSVPERVSFWKDVVRAYIALGWNPNNITGQLEWFDRNQLPHKNGQSNGNGASTGNPMLDAIRRAQQDPGYYDDK